MWRWHNRAMSADEHELRAAWSRCVERLARRAGAVRLGARPPPRGAPPLPRCPARHVGRSPRRGARRYGTGRRRRCGRRRRVLPRRRLRPASVRQRVGQRPSGRPRARRVRVGRAAPPARRDDGRGDGDARCARRSDRESDRPGNRHRRRGPARRRPGRARQRTGELPGVRRRGALRVRPRERRRLAHRPYPGPAVVPRPAGAVRDGNRLGRGGRPGHGPTWRPRWHRWAAPPTVDHMPVDTSPPQRPPITSRRSSSSRS